MSDQWEKDIRARLEAETTIGAGIGDGWWPAVCHAAWLLDHAFPGWQSVQIKEKFAGLRFYIDPAPYPHDVEDESRGREEDRIRWEREWYAAQEAIVSAAESACVDVCEVCGAPAEVRKGGWIHTLCDEHNKRYEERKTMRGIADA